jgi:hypothetical protein
MTYYCQCGAYLGDEWTVPPDGFCDECREEINYRATQDTFYDSIEWPEDEDWKEN